MVTWSRTQGELFVELAYIKTVEGKLNAQELRFGIVLSRFNNLIGDRLLEGALDTCGGTARRRTALPSPVFRGRLNPLIARWMAESGDRAVLTLGAVSEAAEHFD